MMDNNTKFDDALFQRLFNPELRAVAEAERLERVQSVLLRSVAHDAIDPNSPDFDPDEVTQCAFCKGYFPHDLLEEADDGEWVHADLVDEYNGEDDDAGYSNDDLPRCA